MRGQRHAQTTLFPPGKTRYPLYRRLGEPRGPSGQVRKISSPPGFDRRTVQPVASRYTDWAIAAYSSWKHLFGKWKKISCLFTQPSPCIVADKPYIFWSYIFHTILELISIQMVGLHTAHYCVRIFFHMGWIYFAAHSFFMNNTVKNGRIFRAHMPDLVSYSCSYAGLAHIFLPPRVATVLNCSLPNFRVRVFPLPPAKTFVIRDYFQAT